MKRIIKDLPIYISDGNYSSKYPRSEEFVETGIPFIRANNIVNGDITDVDMYYITPEKHDVLQKGHVKTGDVLITTRGNIGQVGIVPDRHNDSNINAQIVLLRVDNKTIFNRYLLWALQSKYAIEQYATLQTGTALKQLPVGRLEQIKIEIVELNNQHYIANVLDQVQNVILLRKQQLAKLNELVKARFVEMFGQITDKKKLEEFTVLITKGASPKWQGVDYCDEGVLFITSENVREGYIDYSKQKFLPDTINRIQPRSKLQRNDILINIVNASIGRAALFESDISANINQAVALVRVKPEIINYKYLLTFLNSDAAHKIYDSMKVGGDKANLSLKNISELFIPNVRIDVQNEFAAFTEQVDKSKVAVQKALDEAQTLFDSLMQQYFG